MIQKETITINGNKFDYTYSDEGFFIERDGIRYANAVDPINSDRAYVETDKKIESESEQ